MTLFEAIPKGSVTHVKYTIPDDEPEPPVERFFTQGLKKQEVQWFKEFITVQSAHAIMLLEQGILTREAGQQIIHGLQQLSKADPASLAMGKHPSALFEIESALTGISGEDAAHALNTALSRIDLGATVTRLVTRGLVDSLLNKMLVFSNVALERAEEMKAVPIPYRTHLQPAQPGTLGHYLLSIRDGVLDVFDQFTSAYPRLNRNPLGTVGRAGTSVPICRDRTTELLGFTSPVSNSYNGKDGAYGIELLSILGQLARALNDYLTDFYYWSSAELGALELPDDFCGHSSYMPQKKNYLVVEAVRADTAKILGWHVTAHLTSRGAGTGDHMLHGVPEDLAQALSIAGRALDAVALITQRFSVNKGRALDAIGWSTASGLSEELTRRLGLTHRDAHGKIRHVVQRCEERKLGPSDLRHETLREFLSEAGAQVSDTDAVELLRALSPEQFLRTRVSDGSVGPEATDVLVRKARTEAMERLKWLNKTVNHSEEASKKLRDSIIKYTQINNNSRVCKDC